MADYKATTAEFQSVANAIRTKGGTQAQLEWPTGFVSAVQAIPTGGGGSSIDPNYSCLYSYYVVKTNDELGSPVSGSYTVPATGKYIAINYIVNGEASTYGLENSISTSGVVVAQDTVAHSYSDGVRNDSFVIKVINCAVGDTIDFSASRQGTSGGAMSCAFVVITVPNLNISGISRDVNNVKNDNTNNSGKTYSFINNNSYHLNIALSCEQGRYDKWTAYAHELHSIPEETYDIGTMSRTITGVSYDIYDKLTHKTICANCIVTDPSKTEIQVWHDSANSYKSHGLISYALTVQNP